VKLFSKNSKACDHSPLTLQTDRWTTYHDNTALRYALRGKNAIKLLKYIEKYCKFVIYFLSYKNLLNETESLFTQPPMRRMRMFYRCFFCFLSVFSRPPQNMRQPFLGTAERIFMKLLPNDTGENGVSNAIPKWELGRQIIFWG